MMVDNLYCQLDRVKADYGTSKLHSLRYICKDIQGSDIISRLNPWWFKNMMMLLAKSRSLTQGLLAREVCMGELSTRLLGSLPLPSSALLIMLGIVMLYHTLPIMMDYNKSSSLQVSFLNIEHLNLVLVFSIKLFKFYMNS